MTAVVCRLSVASTGSRHSGGCEDADAAFVGEAARLGHQEIDPVADAACLAARFNPLDVVDDNEVWTYHARPFRLGL